MVLSSPIRFYKKISSNSYFSIFENIFIAFPYKITINSEYRWGSIPILLQNYGKFRIELKFQADFAVEDRGELEGDLVADGAGGCKGGIEVGC